MNGAQSHSESNKLKLGGRKNESKYELEWEMQTNEVNYAFDRLYTLFSVTIQNSLLNCILKKTWNSLTFLTKCLFSPRASFYITVKADFR